MHCIESYVGELRFVYNFVLRMLDFGGQWSMALKNRGRLKKTEGGHFQILLGLRAVV